MEPPSFSLCRLSSSSASPVAPSATSASQCPILSGPSSPQWLPVPPPHSQYVPVASSRPQYLPVRPSSPPHASSSPQPPPVPTSSPPQSQWLPVAHSRPRFPPRDPPSPPLPHPSCHIRSGATNQRAGHDAEPAPSPVGGKGAPNEKPRRGREVPPPRMQMRGGARNDGRHPEPIETGGAGPRVAVGPEGKRGSLGRQRGGRGANGEQRGATGSPGGQLGGRGGRPRPWDEAQPSSPHVTCGSGWAPSGEGRREKGGSGPGTARRAKVGAGGEGRGAPKVGVWGGKGGGPRGGDVQWRQCWE